MADQSADARGDWGPLLDAFEQRLADARAMGGAERLKRQHGAGRMDARQRIAALCDPGSFLELGSLVGGVARGGLPAAPADGLVTGIGAVDGRPLLVGAEDFTVQGGSIGLGAHAKRVRVARLAAQERLPLVMLLDGAGERATNAFERYPYAPNDLQALADLSGLVPTVAVVMGPSAGHGALTAPLMDLVLMVEGAALFSAGPPLVVAATGERIDKEALGGTGVHVRESGVAHNRAPDDASALEFVRRYLSYLPSHAWQAPPRAPEGPDQGPRRLEAILELVPADPRKPYDARRLVEILADRGTLLELQPDFGASLLTCLVRLGGRALAVVANQPAVRAGAVDRAAADKAAHFLEVAGAFHLPVLFLADNPGVQAGSAAERDGALRSAARMFAAQSRIASPKLHVTVRKAYGFGSSLMAMNPFDRQTLTLAFPGATLGAMPAGGGGAAAGLDAGARDELMSREAAGPWSAADTMSYDEVIDPRELRNVLLRGLQLSDGRRMAPLAPATHSGIRP